MGLLARTILCFLLLIHLSMSSGSYYATAASGYEQGNENYVQEGGLMVRINRQLGHGGGGIRGNGRSSSPRVHYTGGGIWNWRCYPSQYCAPLRCKHNNIGLLAAFIVAIFLAAEF
ncbi:hypothetical protein MKX01_020846 [Papaver californicum]|nr:hypothetical protein MKX01_020846 [Papaver californicum]